MPIVEIELEDGRIAELEVGEGTSDEQIMSFVEQNPQMFDAQTGPRDYALSEVPGAALSNLGSSASEFGGAMLDIVKDPLGTLGTISELGGGVLEYLSPEGPRYTPEGEFLSDNPQRAQQEEYARMAGQYLADRYGGYENVKRTMAEDPVGAGVDILGLVSGGSTLVSKVPGLEKAARVGEIARAIDPVNAAIRGIGYAAPKALAKGARAYEGLITGTGEESITQAARGSEDFVRAMRGEVGAGEIVDTATEGLQNLRTTRGSRFKSGLEKLESETNPVDSSVIKSKLDEKLADFRVTSDGKKLDFSNSDIGGSVEVEEAIKKIYKKIAAQGESLTPRDAYTLRRQIDNVMDSSDVSEAFARDIKGAIDDAIVSSSDDVAQYYPEMMVSYEKSTKLLKDLKKSLSLEGTPEQAMNKLSTALTADKELRLELVDALQTASGKDLKALIAGYNMKGVMPKGGIGRLMAGGAGGGIAMGVIPAQFLTMMAISSPRLIGEVFTVLNIPKRITRKFIGEATKVKAAAIKEGVKGIAQSQPIRAAAQNISQYDEQIQQQLGGM